MASIAAVPACQELFMNRLLSRFPVPKHNFYGYSRQLQQKTLNTTENLNENFSFHSQLPKCNDWSYDCYFFAALDTLDALDLKIRELNFKKQ